MSPPAKRRAEWSHGNDPGAAKVQKWGGIIAAAADFRLDESANLLVRRRIWTKNAPSPAAPPERGWAICVLDVKLGKVRSFGYTMRQIGSLDKATDAQRFSAYLVTQGVAAHAEEDAGRWAIWVRDENDVDQAKTAFEDFRRYPESKTYQGVERAADSIRREEARQRELATQNVITMRGRWGKQGMARKAPLVFVLIGLSVLATIWTDFGKNATANHLGFLDRAVLQADGNEDVDPRDARIALLSIQHGQAWRLITPIFVHLSVLHLVFNMYMAYVFGAQIEDRKGTWFLGTLVILIAVISNVAQAVIELPFFFGMSGVVFGLFGYAWMKSAYDPAAGIVVRRSTVVLFVVWFFLCMTGVVGNIANTAHGVGMGVGIAIGYAPILLRSLGKSSSDS